MNMNEYNLCYGCMTTLDESQKKCKKCGHVNGTIKADCYLLEGTIIHSRYIIGKVLGHGGFGITYIAYDTRINSVVAIKEYLPGDFSIRIQNKNEVVIYDGDKRSQFQTGLEKFLEEAKTMAKYNHYKGVVTTKDFIQENNTAYIVMEFLDGETVEEYLNRNEGFTNYYSMLEIMYPVMESLILLHQDGIIHRDISPDNIYITKDNKIKIIDFGAARESVNEVKNYSIVLKPGYAPEEQYRSKGIQGPFTDVYAIGATMYKMLTGVTPVESMERILGDKELQPLSDYNLKLSKKQISIIEKGLAINSADRYQTVGEFKKALEKASTKTNQTLRVIKNVALTVTVITLIGLLSSKLYFDYYLVFIPDGINAYEVEVVEYLERNNISYEIKYAFDPNVKDKVVIKQNVLSKRIKPNDKVSLTVCDKRLEKVKFADEKLTQHFKTIYGLEDILVKDVENIKSLDLNYLGLESISGLRYFSSLESLNLNDNNLESVNELSSLSHLEYLDLSNNSIRNTEFVKDMESLKILDLSNNEIVSERLAMESESLNQLILSDNYLRFLDEQLDLPNLKVLNLINNNLEEISNLDSLLSLIQLNLSYNNLSEIDSLSVLDNLVILDLSSNEIDKLGAITHLKNLRNLDLSQNRVDHSDSALKIIGVDCEVVVDGE